LHGEIAGPFVDVHHRTDEVNADRVAGSGAKDISPELLAFLPCPGIRALVDRDDERRDGAQGLEEVGFCGFDACITSLQVE
jgi:hypothetical protein